jgi:hypothetical protein
MQVLEQAVHPLVVLSTKYPELQMEQALVLEELHCRQPLMFGHKLQFVPDR